MILNVTFKTSIISLLVILLVIGGVAAGAYYFAITKSYEMAGNIQNADNGKIVVYGSLRSNKNSSYLPNSNKKITFTVTDKTVLKKTIIKIPVDPTDRSGISKTQTAGRISDLKEGVSINKIVAKENLLKTDTATATEIEYQVFEGIKKPGT